ncbi:MAG: transposase, partial [bacterium]|nr:transposase [bacterium]
MPGCATEGTRLAKLVRMAIPICRAAQRACPRTGPGAPPTFADWQIAVLILIAILARRKSKSAQYRYLWERRSWLIDRLDLPSFPGRSTYFDRYRRAAELFRAGVIEQARRALSEGLIDPEVVAVDKSLVRARGPVRHQRKGRQRRRLRGTDDEASWGFSDHHGWVYGYSFEVAVTATVGSLVYPLTVSVGTAGRAEAKSFPETVAQLPGETRYVTADRGYDTNANGQAVEYDEKDRPTGRRLVCPLQGRAGKPSVGKVVHRGRRERLRQRRAKRLKFFKSRTGRRLYARRLKTVEPFMEWLKAKFELSVRAWHRGLQN